MTHYFHLSHSPVITTNTRWPICHRVHLDLTHSSVNLSLSLREQDEWKLFTFSLAVYTSHSNLQSECLNAGSRRREREVNIRARESSESSRGKCYINIVILFVLRKMEGYFCVLIIYHAVSSLRDVQVFTHVQQCTRYTSGSFIEPHLRCKMTRRKLQFTE